MQWICSLAGAVSAIIVRPLSLRRALPWPLLQGTTLVVVLAVPAYPQTGDQGAIEGTVVDPSGAVVAGVSLKARNVGTAAAFTAATNEIGLFRFQVLPLGTYELTAERAGFATLVVSHVEVMVGARVNLPLSLGLAEVSQSITVSVGAPILETTRSQVSATIDRRLISSLPVNGRDFMSFTLLTPGVTRSPRGSLSFGGQLSMNSFLLDGADNYEPLFGAPQGGGGGGSTDSRGPHQLSQDAVQEFQVNSSGYSAELGRAGGGVINVVTKSGTNEFHGSGYWYFRDKALNANDAVNNANGKPKPPFHMNQFGGTLGGPVFKDRLFFFANYEGDRSTNPNTVIFSLPTAFRLSADPKVATFQQQALDYLTPLAASWVRPVEQNDHLVKLDWRLAPAHLFSGRWNHQRYLSSTTLGPQMSYEHEGPSLNSTDTVAVSLTSTVSPSTVNVARISYDRGDLYLGFQSTNPEAIVSEPGKVLLQIGTPGTSPQESSFQRAQWADTLSYVRASHSIKAGADVLLERVTFYTGQNFGGSYIFNSLESFGRSLAGTPVPGANETYTQILSGDGSRGSTTHPNTLQVGGFVQDEWRPRPRLTLNLGLRYDLQQIARPPVRNPSPALAIAGLDTSALPTDKTDFAPRLGFAWTPFKGDHMVVRGGYGMFYARTPVQYASRAHYQNGITTQTVTLKGATSGADLIPAYPNNLCGPPDPSGAPPNCAAPSVAGNGPIIQLFSRNLRLPSVQQGSVGIEAQFQKDLAVLVSYIGSKGTHLLRARDINLATPTTRSHIGIAGTDTVLTYQKYTLPHPIAGFDRIIQFETEGNSIYHGVIMQVTKRFSHNFQALASYTLSKVIDDKPDANAGNPGPGGDPPKLSDPMDVRADRAAGINDQRHRFVLSGVWDLNYVSHLPKSTKAILGGWQVSGILTAQSGQPYSGLLNNFDLNNDGNPYTDRTPGLGRNTFYLPATVSLDPRVTRTVRLSERTRLELIAEAFNVFNRTNVSGVNTTQYAVEKSSAVCGEAGTPCLVPQNTGLNAFGTPTATLGARVMQLAVRLVF